jgi:geranylgeranyl diphosphate synthase, type I
MSADWSGKKPSRDASRAEAPRLSRLPRRADVDPVVHQAASPQAVQPLGFAGAEHLTSRTRHGWAKALQLAPDLYPGVGGKRLRATLLERSYAFAGGRSAAPELVVDAVEMLHAGALVIDDFEDGSLTRRGQPALHRVIGPARAVNAGNWMYFRALELATMAGGDPASSAALVGRFIAVARQCHEGQAIDLATPVDEVMPAQAFVTALAISRWKTGRLTSLAAWCGGHSAGGDRDTLEALAAFGCRVGICLQMRNDMDELSELLAGSDRCDDLRNRRVTWPWAWAAGELAAREFHAWQCRLRHAGGDPAAFRPLARDLLDLTSGRAVAAINGRLDRAIERLAVATGQLRDTGPLAAVCDCLRIAIEPEPAEIRR